MFRKFKSALGKMEGQEVFVAKRREDGRFLLMKFHQGKLAQELKCSFSSKRELERAFIKIAPVGAVLR